MVLKYMDKYWKKAFDEYGGPLLKALIGEDVISHKPTESVQIDPKLIIEIWFLKKISTIGL